MFASTAMQEYSSQPSAGDGYRKRILEKGGSLPFKKRRFQPSSSSSSSSAAFSTDVSTGLGFRTESYHANGTSVRRQSLLPPSSSSSSVSLSPPRDPQGAVSDDDSQVRRVSLVERKTADEHLAALALVTAAASTSSSSNASSSSSPAVCSPLPSSSTFLSKSRRNHVEATPPKMTPVSSVSPLPSTSSKQTRAHHPPLSSPLPGGCHGRTSRNNSYCRRQPCYNGSNYCKLHYQQLILGMRSSALSTCPSTDGELSPSGANGSSGVRGSASAVAHQVTPNNARHTQHSQQQGQQQQLGKTLQGAPTMPNIMLHQDKRFTGTGDEVRCQATTTRGRACAYVSVNGTKYCYLHADYDTNPPPRRGGSSKSNQYNSSSSKANGGIITTNNTSSSSPRSARTTNTLPPHSGLPSVSLPSLRGGASAGGDSSSSSSSLLLSSTPSRGGHPPHHGSTRSGKGPNGRSGKSSNYGSSSRHQKGKDSPFPLLSMISTEQWSGKRVIVGTGPLVNRTGRVEKWGNGWVSVHIDGVGVHNRRSFELLLHQDQQGEEVGNVSRASTSTKSKVDARTKATSSAPAPALTVTTPSDVAKNSAVDDDLAVKTLRRLSGGTPSNVPPSSSATSSAPPSSSTLFSQSNIGLLNLVTAMDSSSSTRHGFDAKNSNESSSSDRNGVGSTLPPEDMLPLRKGSKPNPTHIQTTDSNGMNLSGPPRRSSASSGTASRRISSASSEEDEADATARSATQPPIITATSTATTTTTPPPSSSRRSSLGDEAHGFTTAPSFVSPYSSKTSLSSSSSSSQSPPPVSNVSRRFTSAGSAAASISSSHSSSSSSTDSSDYKQRLPFSTQRSTGGTSAGASAAAATAQATTNSIANYGGYNSTTPPFGGGVDNMLKTAKAASSSSSSPPPSSLYSSFANAGPSIVTPRSSVSIHKSLIDALLHTTAADATASAATAASSGSSNRPSSSNNA